MSVWRWLSAVTVWFVAGMACAQATGGLEVRLEPSRKQTKGLPSMVVVRLVNLSDQEMLLPEPLKDCTGWQTGGVQFWIEGPDPKQMETTCIADGNGGAISPAMRMKDWKRLRPGESLVFPEDITAKLVGWQGRLPTGRFVLKARYDAPVMSKEELAYLVQEGLGAATGSIEARLTVIRQSRR